MSITRFLRFLNTYKVGNHFTVTSSSKLMRSQFLSYLDMVVYLPIYLKTLFRREIIYILVQQLRKINIIIKEKNSNNGKSED